ncbi:Prostaglandin reductase 1 [Bulinus truncatus]|nr:Prostaglandin reductase 1 [Bulinus truncatus]
MILFHFDYRVLESKAADYPVGSLVCVHAGWRSHSIIDVRKSRSYGTKVVKVEEVPGVPPSLWLGAAGMPGVTAFMAFYNKCWPKSGEVIVVSSAAGAVGSVGLTVIGVAGSAEKCSYLKNLGFDHAIHYKTDDISAALDRASPTGVDIYFDNVGGEISEIVLSKMKPHGRVLICGSVSTYNTEDKTKGRSLKTPRPGKSVTTESFAIFTPENLSHFEEVRWKLISLIKEGKLKTKEHVTEGFENMPVAFIGLFTGANFGKALVKA